VESVRELRSRIEGYRDLLKEGDRRYRTSKEEIMQRMVSGMLADATQRLKRLEQDTVKLYRIAEVDLSDSFLRSLPVPRERNA
jgi:hypothetical protein